MPTRSTVESSSAGPEELRVYLLGPPLVEWGGAYLSISRRQVRALLYRLAAEAKPVSRDRLCFLFWPDTPDSVARRNLSRLLTHLRRALPYADLLVASGDRVGLDSARLSCDLRSFSRFSETANPTQQLHAAADLYRGPLLEGFSLPESPEFEDWLIQEQRAWSRRYLELLNTLIERHAAHEELEAAIACALRYLAADELSEDVHRRLIALYAAVGDRAAATRQFEYCAAVLERELGVSPLPQTRAVYESALKDVEPPRRTAPHLTWATLPSLEVPLVGRDAAYAQLEAALSGARAGQGGIVFISGEPGIGKSRLLEEFATGGEDKALFLFASARAGGHSLPYQPVLELFRLVPDLEVLTSSVPPIWLAEAARVLPELGQLDPHLSRPLVVEPAEARSRLLEALCRMMLGLGDACGPLVLCVDDLHWADRGTLDWLACLARSLAHRRMLILATYRTGHGRVLEELRHNLLRLSLLSEFTLTGLTSQAVLEIVEHLTGRRRGRSAFSIRLHRITGGNPFFLLETLRVLLGAGDLPADLDDVGAVPLPHTVRQAVEERLRRLHPRSRQILDAGAVLGTSFGFDLVCRTAGRGEVETVHALDEAVARQVLAESSSGYRFQHALIRQTVEEALGPVRRHLLHRRAARALEAMEPHAAARIALHFDLADEAEKALHHYRRAARRASDVFAWEKAEELESQALAMLDRLDPDCSKRGYVTVKGELFRRRAHARYLLGQLKDRDADLLAFAALAESAEDDSLRLMGFFDRAHYLNLGGHYEEAVAEAEQGLVLATKTGDSAAQARLLAHIGFARYFLGQPGPALAALESAIERSGERLDPDMRGRIVHILGYVHYHLGNYSRALDYHHEAYSCSSEMGDQNRQAWNLMDIGFLELELGRFDDARTHLNESLELARRIAARPAEAYALTLLGDWDHYTGRYTSAVDRFDEASRLQAEVGSKHGIVADQGGAGFAFYHLGDLEQARDRLRRAQQRARAIHHRRQIALSQIRLGLVELAAGSHALAEQLLTEALKMARESECAENETAALAALARTARLDGDLTGAFTFARQAAEVAQRFSLVTCGAWAELEIGLGLLAHRESEQALEHTTLALGNVHRTHEAWIGTEELYRGHARVLEALGRVDEARLEDELADSVIQAKAERVADPDAREHYLHHVGLTP